MPVHAIVTATRAQEDFPAAVSDGRAGAWVVYVAHEPRGPEGSPRPSEEPESFKSYVPSGGGDQVKLVHFNGTTADRRSTSPTPVSTSGGPPWRQGATGVVVVWSEFRDGNWDLYARRLNTAGGAWSGTPQQLTNDPGADTDAVLATGADGVVWMAWQAWRNGQADILLAPVDDLVADGQRERSPGRRLVPVTGHRPPGPPLRGVRQLQERQLRRPALPRR